MHLWQMKDPEFATCEGVCTEEWIFRPTTLQMHVDKQFAAYQLNLHEGQKLLAKGSISATKYDKIVDDAISPLVLMHGSGQPATARYVKERIFQEPGETMKLKDSQHCFIEEYVSSSFLCLCMVL